MSSKTPLPTGEEKAHHRRTNPHHTRQEPAQQTRHTPTQRGTPKPTKNGVKQMASILDTLLSSQGSGAHRTQAFRLSFGATVRTYPARRNPVNFASWPCGWELVTRSRTERGQYQVPPGPSTCRPPTRSPSRPSRRPSTWATHPTPPTIPGNARSRAVGGAARTAPSVTCGSGG